jgi:hypothetical protein
MTRHDRAGEPRPESAAMRATLLRLGCRDEEALGGAMPSTLHFRLSPMDLLSRQAVIASVL